MRKITLLFVPCVAALVVTAAVADESWVEATEAMKRGDWARAAELYVETIENSPPWAAGHVALAQCRFMLGRPEEARASLDRAVEIDPEADVFAGYAFGGFKLYDAGRYDEAILPLTEALPLAPAGKREPVSARLAHALYRSEKYAQAAERLAQHLESFGFEPVSAYFLALSRRQTGERDAALRMMERAAAAGLGDERSTRALRYLADWSAEDAWAAADPDERASRLKTALGHARAWRDGEPGAETLTYWFDLARAAGAIEQAAEWLESSTPGPGRACLRTALLAEAHALSGRAEPAAQRVADALACDGALGRAHLAHALALLGAIDAEYDSSDAARRAAGRVRQAREAAQRARRLDPSLESRVAGLAERIAATESALGEAIADLARNEGEIEIALDRAKTERCRVIHWDLKTDRAAVTEADREFYDANDCRARVEREAGRDG